MKKTWITILAILGICLFVILLTLTSQSEWILF